MKIRTRLTLWYAGMLLGSLLLMGGVLHYELIGEYARGMPPESPSVKIADILMFYGVPTVIVLVLGGSWLMRRAMRPVETLAASAERVHAGNLAERIPLTGKGDELDRLADAFNAMLARVEAGTASVRDFAINASHELKTPLTILSAETELALGDPSIGAPERSRLLSQSEELHRLGRLVDALALAAKADAGMPVIARERLDFHELVRQAVDDTRVLGDPHGIIVELVRCDDAPLDGDPAGLRQVLLNLLDNAVKHNSPGGWVRVELRSAREDATLLIDNSGEAISAEIAPRLFQRFIRGPGPAAGSGLGLSIAKLIVEAHGGTIAYSAPEVGTVRFAVHLPCRRP
jgi:two-component system, OmpR family, heavy metal sensor histidine kinase CusS